MEIMRVAEQLEKRAEKFSKYNVGASTSKYNQNDKGLLPTPNDKMVPLEETSEVRKINVPDPSLSHIECYRCNEIGHKSNTCPKRRELRLVEVKDKEVVESDGTNSDDQFGDKTFPDEGPHLSCLIHRTCHVPRVVDLSQRTNLFRTRGTIN